MGALTEISERRDNEDAFYMAERLLRSYGADCPPEELERAGELSDLYDVRKWYDRMTGRKEWRIFVYYDFWCKNHPNAPQGLKDVCDKNPDVFEYVERPCKDSDFFLFRPQDEDIGVKLGLDIRIKEIMEPGEVSKYFEGVMLDSSESVTGEAPLRLTW